MGEQVGQLVVFVGVQVPVPVERGGHRCDTGPGGDGFDGGPLVDPRRDGRVAQVMYAHMTKPCCLDRRVEVTAPEVLHIMRNFVRSSLDTGLFLTGPMAPMSSESLRTPGRAEVKPGGDGEIDRHRR